MLTTLVAYRGGGEGDGKGLEQDRSDVDLPQHTGSAGAVVRAGEGRAG